MPAVIAKECAWVAISVHGLERVAAAYELERRTTTKGDRNEHCCVTARTERDCVTVSAGERKSITSDTWRRVSKQIQKAQ
ncbi:hypothetical protein [Natrinema halophilum]|uniref:Uncharacterized protein n=1 Tax=Natrinema halophilum TaxID=1699371 RepID=A0A7D5GK87_9EURY|nr:hypothetical protein [Natrinema halophilum]QLG48452.1 hypothetical protein HYG82_06120 [Natrinema halophilum]